MRQARARAAGLALFVSLGTLTACGTNTDGPATPGDDKGFIAGDGRITILKPDERADAVVLAGPKLGGGTLDLAAYKGKVVLLNVWGSWCSPCRKEGPYLQAAWDQTRAKGDVQFLGLNTKQDSQDAAAAFERRFGITYPSFYDPDGSLLLTFRKTIPPQAIPSTLVFDKQGRLAARIIGPGSRGNFVELIDQIRAEA